MQTAVISELLQNWNINFPDEAQISELGNGLIHGTFKITTARGDFVLQNFNNQVFQFPDRIDSNQRLLAREGKIDQENFKIPLPLPTQTGERIVSLDGGLFRLFEFVPGKSIEHASDPKQAYLAAKAYGEFSKLGSQVTVASLQESIPNFHRLDLRYARFIEVQENVQELTLEEVEIRDFYISQSPLIRSYTELSKELPIRLTHSDTKLNNLIFSDDLTSIRAVVDLDTIMPGFLLYDFGDLVRTAACQESENSENWEKIALNMDLFLALLNGYLDGFGAKNMTKTELDSLLIAGEVMTCIMGLRFFTDHLEGNKYYRVSHPKANLYRAKNQMLLLQSLQSKRSRLKKELDSAILSDKN